MTETEKSTAIKLMDPEAASAFMIQLLEHLVDWKIPTAERFRNAVLGPNSALAFNPLLGIREANDIGFIRQAINETVAEGRMIDFGFIPNKIIKEESIRSRTMFEAGEFPPPYETWIAVHSWEGGMCGYYFAQHPELNNQILAIELYGVSVPNVTDAIVVYDIVSIHARGIGDTVVSPARMIEENYSNNPEILHERGANCLDPLVTMLRFLADASIPIVDKPAPVKLNRIRAKQGKFLIPPHTQVQTRDYVSAFASAPTKGEGKGGHHASPISHWRRAHQRHLQDGRVVPVRSSKVNWRETEELHRIFYRLPREKC